MCKLSSIPDHYIYWVGLLANCVNTFLGVVILSFGLSNNSAYREFHGKVFPSTSIEIVATILACLIIIAGIAGILTLASWKWQYIVVHAIFAAIVAVALFAVGVYYYAMFDQKAHSLDVQGRMATLFESMEFLAFNSSSVDDLQRRFQCCGLLSWQDYKLEAWLEHPVPRSCCKNTSSDRVSCHRDKIDQDARWNDGCLWKILVFSSLSTTEMRLFMVGSSFPVLQSAVLSGILAHFIRHRYL